MSGHFAQCRDAPSTQAKSRLSTWMTASASCEAPPRMSWKETCAAYERDHVVKLVRNGISVSLAARTLCSSLNKAYKWC